MCGIVGILQKPNHPLVTSDMDFFMTMLVFDTVRGLDGTGVFGVQTNGDTDWMRVGSDPFTLYRSKAWKKMYGNTSKYRALIGHNRKATSGTIESESSHPFVESPIIVVHNGFVEDHKKLAKTTVDSHAIAHVLADSKDPKEGLLKLSGAFSIVWYDARDHKLRFIRNEQRPLWIANDNFTYFLCSEQVIMEYSAKKSGNKTLNDLKEIPTNTMFTYDLDTGELQDETASFKPKPTVTSTVYHGYPTSSGGGGYTGGKQLPVLTTPRTTTPTAGTTISSPGDLIAILEKEYPIDATMMVKPSNDTNPIQHGIKGIHPVTGADMADYRVVCTPTNPQIAKCIVKVHLAATTYLEAQRWSKRDRFAVKIKGLLTTPTGDVLVIASDPKEPQKFKTYNGVTLTAAQIVKAKHTKLCRNCGGVLHVGEAAGWSVKLDEKTDAVAKVVCPACVLKGISALPADQRTLVQERQGLHPWQVQ